MKRAIGVGLALAISAIAPAIADTGSDDGPHVAFDQITLMSFGPNARSIPSPGPFAALRATVDSEAKDPGYPPPGGDAIPSIENLSRLSHGVLVRKYFYGKLSRVDDPITDRSTILRPDKGIVIYLDHAASTYHIVSGDAARAILDPAPFTMPSNSPFSIASPAAAASETTGTASPPATSTGDSETIAMTNDTHGIDGVELDGVETRGLQTTLAMTASNVTGTCPAISTSMVTTRYVDPSRDEPPKAAANAGLNSALLKNMPTAKCHFTIAPSATKPPVGDENDFTLYQRTDTATTVPALASPIVVSLLVVRGNVTTLVAKDAKKFEIPETYKELP